MYIDLHDIDKHSLQFNRSVQISRHEKAGRYPLWRVLMYAIPSSQFSHTIKSVTLLLKERTNYDPVYHNCLKIRSFTRSNSQELFTESRKRHTKPNSHLWRSMPYVGYDEVCQPHDFWSPHPYIKRRRLIQLKKSVLMTATVSTH